MTFLLVWEPGIAPAQTLQKIIFVENASSAMVGEILLPGPVSDDSGQKIIITGKQDFIRVFPDADPSLTSEVNFIDNRIVGLPYCPLCLMACSKISGGCHDGECIVSHYWYVESKKPLFELKHEVIPACESCVFIRDFTKIDTDSLFSVFRKECNNQWLPDVDFSREIILAKRSWGDCKARYVHKVVLDSLSKKLIWKEFNIYGGCRAAGSKETCLVVPRPPAGFDVEIQEILIRQW